MNYLAGQKRFPGPTGVETPARVIVSTPIPRREVPLEGTKSMLFPPGRIDEILPISMNAQNDASSRHVDFAKLARDILFWPVVLPVAIIVYFFLSVILFCLLT
jgi:hypothetical protein